MSEYRGLFLTVVLLVGLCLAGRAVGESAAPQQGEFMGLPEDQEQLAETETGREYVSMTMVRPGQWDTYEYLKRTGRVIADERRDGRVYYAIERQDELEVSFFDEDAPETVTVVHRYRAKIPDGQSGASADVPPDRVVDDIPYEDESPFANFAPECFALMCEGAIVPYKLDAYATMDACVSWAAQRAVERGEAECAALAEHAPPLREIEEQLMDYATTAREIDEEDFSRVTLERRIWHVRPMFLPSQHDSDEFSVDLSQPVTPGAILAANLSAYDFRGQAAWNWRREGEEPDAFRPRLREAAEQLAAEGGFVAGPELIARGTIPPDKQMLYEHACRKAEFLGVYMLRGLLVDVSAVEMGISGKSPAEQEQVLADWEDQLDSVRNYAADYGADDLLSFPGRRPWLPTAGEAMGLDTGLTAEDLANEESVDEFIAALESDDVAERREGAWNLMRISSAAAPASEKLAKAASDEDPTVRKYAVWALSRIGSDAESPPVVADVLLHALANDADADMRQRAAMGLASLGYVAETVIDGLMGALADEEETVVWAAAFGLVQLEIEPEIVVPQLAALLEADDTAHVCGAARALGYMGQDAAEAAPRLAELLDSEDEDVRMAALQALARIEDDYEAIIPIAIEMLDHPDADTRRMAAYCLGQVGAAAVDAIPALIDALTDEEDEYMPSAASYALRNIGIDAEHVPAMLALLAHELPDTREGAAFALGGATVPDKSQIAAALVNMLADEERDVRSAACYSLTSFGSQAAFALPALRELADSTEDATVRTYATSAVESIEQSMGEQEPVMIEE